MGAKETTENFWEAWNNFVWPDPVPISYRLYYHEDGRPDFYTMEHLPGRYIEVSQEVYIHSPRNVRVINGILEFIPLTKTYQKLKPRRDGGTRCHPQDVCVVVDDNVSGSHWRLDNNETH